MEIMGRRGKVWVVALWMMSSMMSPAFAVERNAVPVSSTSIATPPITSTEGSITLLNLKSRKPHLTLTAADGSSWALEINRATTTVWKKGQNLTLSQLKIGDQIKVRHLTKKGKHVAKSIEVL